jgi:hypothetical protein
MRTGQGNRVVLDPAAARIGEEINARIDTAVHGSHVERRLVLFSCRLLSGGKRKKRCDYGDDGTEAHKRHEDPPLEMKPITEAPKSKSIRPRHNAPQRSH